MYRVSLSGWLSMGYALFTRFDGTGNGILAGCDRQFVTWTRPLILKAAVQASAHPVMMVETDVLLYKDIRPLGASLLEKSTNGATVVAGIEGSGRANTGTIYATKASLPLLRAWAEQSDRCLNSKDVDKSALQHLVHFSAKAGDDLGQCHDAEEGEQCYKEVTWAMKTGLSRHRDWYSGLSASSSWADFQLRLHHIGGKGCARPCAKAAGAVAAALAYFPASEVGQCQRKGKSATHFNCVDLKEKAETMKSMHDWAEGISTEPEAVLE